MSLVTDQAVVLRRSDFSESSQVVVVLTHQYGKLSLLAKGIKRGTRSRFAPAIDLLEMGRAVWSHRPEKGQHLSPLTEWKQSRCYPGLREKAQRLYAGQYAAEIASELVRESDPHPALFDAMIEFLDAEDSSDFPLVPLCRFQRALLVEAGLMFQVQRCAGCRKEISSDNGAEKNRNCFYFSSHEGGLICRDCEASFVEKRAVDADTFRGLVLEEYEQAAAGVFDLFNYHISHLIGKAPCLADYVMPAALRRQLNLPA